MDNDRKAFPVEKGGKAKVRASDSACKNCGKKGHSHLECKGEPICFYCKEKGHRLYECPQVKKKQGNQMLSTRKPVGVAAADTPEADDDGAEDGEEDGEDETVAAVGEQVSDRLELSNPSVGISAIEERKCELAALIDTGSPVSFIKYSVFCKFFEPTGVKVEPSTRRLRDLGNNALKILGVVRTTIAIREMGDRTLPVNLYVFYGNSFEGDIILGREFLRDQRLVLEYKIFDSWEGEPDAGVNLFSFLPLCISDGESERETNDRHARN